MPLGLINGGPFRPFNRAISARCSTTVRSSSATLPNSPTTSSRSWADDRTSRSNGGLTQSLNLTSPRRGKEKVHDRPGFCPCYPETREVFDFKENSRAGAQADQGSFAMPPPCPPTLTATPSDPAALLALEPRKWVYGHFLIRRFLSVLGAPGGTGKTAY